MKRFLVPMLVVVLLIALVVPANVASWEEKITGGGQAVAGGIYFSITVSAWTADEGGAAGGQMQYSRVGQSVPDLSVHAKIQCVGINNLADGTVVAIVAGPADVQNDPGGQIGSGNWMIVEILEGGIGSGDQVSVRLCSEANAPYKCENPSGSYPGLIYDGNFNIRSK